jgi:hypothetical protein
MASATCQEFRPTIASASLAAPTIVRLEHALCWRRLPLHLTNLARLCSGVRAARTIRLEGELRTENVTGWAGLWLRADAEAHPNLFFDNMSRRPVVGTTRWGRHFIDAPLPGNTDWLNYGIVLAGAGTLYADKPSPARMDPERQMGGRLSPINLRRPSQSGTMEWPYCVRSP